MRRRIGAVPAILVVAALLVGIIGTMFAAPAPSLTPAPLGSFPLPPAGTPRPAPTPMGRYPRSAEATVVGSCVSGIDPATVPGPIAQAFCVCVLNAYEQLYPSYDEFQRATISEDLRTQISNRCVQAIVGG